MAIARLAAVCRMLVTSRTLERSISIETLKKPSRRQAFSSMRARTGFVTVAGVPSAVFNALASVRNLGKYMRLSSGVWMIVGPACRMPETAFSCQDSERSVIAGTR